MTRGCERRGHLRSPSGQRCAPSRRPSCCAPFPSAWSCWPRQAWTTPWWSTSTRSGPKKAPDDFVREALSGPWGRGPGGGSRLPLRAPSPGTWPCWSHGRGRGFEVVGLDLVGADGAAGDGRRRGLLHRHPPAPCRRATSPPPPRRWVGPTRCAARWSAGTGGPENWAFAPRTSTCPNNCLPAMDYAGGYLVPMGWPARPRPPRVRPPTFDQQADVSLLEAHLLEFEDDLYESRPGAVRGPAAGRGAVRDGGGPGGCRWLGICDQAGDLLRGWYRAMGSSGDLVPGSVGGRQPSPPPPSPPNEETMGAVTHTFGRAPGRRRPPPPCPATPSSWPAATASG